MADLAGAEIIAAAQQKDAEKAAELKTKRNAWRKSKLVRRVSEKSTTLDTVVEVTTPPASPEMIQMEDNMPSLGATMDSLSINDDAYSENSSPNLLDVPRRGSLPESIESVSDAGSQELGVTELTPTFGKRKGRQGVHAGSHRLSADMKSVLDLSTQLVGESLDLDFCCEFVLTRAFCDRRLTLRSRMQTSSPSTSPYLPIPPSSATRR